MFTTRTECINFLVSQGLVEPLCKVAINECFNQVPVPAEEDNDLCRVLVSEVVSQVVKVPEDVCLAAYDEVIGNDVEIKHDGIYILDELKYNLEGELIPQPEPAPAEQNAPSTETVQ